MLPSMYGTFVKRSLTDRDLPDLSLPFIVTIVFGSSAFKIPPNRIREEEETHHAQHGAREKWLLTAEPDLRSFYGTRWDRNE